MVRNGGGMAIMVLSWRIRYVWHMCKCIGFQRADLAFAWMCSGSDPDLWDDETPRDCVNEELSCWYE